MLKCLDCLEYKDVKDFHKDSSRSTGFKAYCKPCRKVRAKRNYCSTKARENYLKNREALLAYRKKYVKLNADKISAGNTPKWLTDFHLAYMKSLYVQASFLRLHVDHIVPLRGKTVCGLHVPWNLQLLEPKENLMKGNKLTGGGLSVDS